jgi:hypothetical protein
LSLSIFNNSGSHKNLGQTPRKIHQSIQDGKCSFLFS